MVFGYKKLFYTTVVYGINMICTQNEPLFFPACFYITFLWKLKREIIAEKEKEKKKERMREREKERDDEIR